MFNDIFQVILQLALSLLGIAFLFRAWLYAIRMPPFNPYSMAILQVTDWAIQPIRKLIPTRKFIDIPSLLAAWLCAVIFLLGSSFLLTGQFVSIELMPRVLLASVFTTLKWAFDTAWWLLLIQVILSWVNARSPITPFLQALTNPIMNPIRKRLPATGAIDFSPLIALLGLQILNMVVQRLSFVLIGL
ncbi:YggT family protein [Paenalcaligenes faecalis]|uniref:YggT family protein n=1 Tax=Paenalcaligenes faecalis TaxID=2980099 RepID=UPI0022B9CAE5|nr:YggT family protein [Paenalcaligenes faecalis]